MFKRIFIIILFLSIYSTSYSQYTENHHYAGPTLGFSFLGSSVQLGGNYEYAMYIEKFGIVGIGGFVRYWTYTESVPGYKWSYTDFLIGAQGNYHFKIPGNDMVDTWAGLALGYDAGSVDYIGPPDIVYVTPSYGGFFIGLQGGARYWITPDLALSGRLSFGNLSYGSIDIGVDFKF